ncbi:MAG: CotH kinase family protein [Planctomycetes bacterium]|nr:CotH kinase family protein [Planctomycetota bacterium]
MQHRTWYFFLFAFIAGAPLLAMQPEAELQFQPDKKEFGKKDFGGPGGFGMKTRRKLVEQFDKNGDGWLNAEERKAAREFIKKEGGGKGGFGKGFPGGKGKGGFGPGMFITKPLVEALDADNDGKIAKAELVTGVKKFFTDADKDKKGSLDEKQLADALNKIMPTPGFPGGGKGGPFGGGLGNLIAGEILKKADARKTGKVTLAELTTAAETLFTELDKDKTGKLDEAAVAAGVSQLIPPPPGGGFGFGGKGRDPAKPGPKVDVKDVKNYPDHKLYDTSILRTIFIEFENKDWEAELADFYRTDVEVPALVTVDGKQYKNAGIHFRGNSSYFMVPAGYKHSLNLSFDLVDSKQRLLGYKTLNLLNCADDPTFMHTVLYCNMARMYMPAPQANLVKVVINGESWGIFANQQQFNKEFTKENYQSTKGTRWRVPGHPGASAGLGYIGENIADYKRHYLIKSTDDEKEWKALIEVCRVLNKTPIDKLEEALRPILDVDEVLWFLALDNAVINDDGYWTRASDYSLYRDPKGKFHLVPYDTNETFQPMGGGKGGFGKGGPGGGFGKGGPGGGKGGGYALDPLAGVNNSRTPLYRMLNVPTLRKKYLLNLQTIANEQFDWKKLKPVIDGYRSLIEKEVELDTRKLYSLTEFREAHAEDGASRNNLRAFADGRRSYLLNHPEIKKLSER